MNKIFAILLLAILLGGAYLFLRQDPALPTTTDTQAVTEADNELRVSGALGVIKDQSSYNYLTDKNGMTIYINIKDQNSTNKVTPTCDATCEKSWPPYLAEDNENVASDLGRLSTFKRADGRLQYVLDNLALYYYAKDQKPGDTFGANVAGWAIARP